jgi:hypothetical protein
MIEMWANLLASAAEEDAVSPRFVSILGEINSRQARTLAKLGPSDPNYSEQAIQMKMHSAELFLHRHMRPHTAPETILGEQLNKLFENDPKSGVYPIYGEILPDHMDVTGDKVRFVKRKRLSDIEKLDYAILGSLGLVERLTLSRKCTYDGIDLVHVIYYRTTDLASHLLRITQPV